MQLASVFLVVVLIGFSQQIAQQQQQQLDHHSLLLWFQNHSDSVEVAAKTIVNLALNVNVSMARMHDIESVRAQAGTVTEILDLKEKLKMSAQDGVLVEPLQLMSPGLDDDSNELTLTISPINKKRDCEHLAASLIIKRSKLVQDAGTSNFAIGTEACVIPRNSQMNLQEEEEEEIKIEIVEPKDGQMFYNAGGVLPLPIEVRISPESAYIAVYIDGMWITNGAGPAVQISVDVAHLRSGWHTLEVSILDSDEEKSITFGLEHAEPSVGDMRGRPMPGAEKKIVSHTQIYDSMEKNNMTILDIIKYDKDQVYCCNESYVSTAPRALMFVSLKNACFTRAGGFWSNRHHNEYSFGVYDDDVYYVDGWTRRRLTHIYPDAVWIPGRVVVAVTGFYMQWQHTILDTLPIVAQALHILQNDSSTQLLFGVYASASQLLQLMGVDLSRVINFPIETKPFCASELIVPMYLPDLRMSYRPTMGYHALNQAIFKGQNVPLSDRNYAVWVSRKNSRLGRDFLNEKHVFNAFKEFVEEELDGLTVMLFDGEWALNDTMKLFHSARIVVGAHGGGMANVIFCSADHHTVIIELLVGGRNARNYHAIVHGIGGDYRPLYLRSSAGALHGSSDGPVNITPEQLIGYLAALKKHGIFSAEKSQEKIAADQRVLKFRGSPPYAQPDYHGNGPESEEPYVPWGQQWSTIRY